MSKRHKKLPRRRRVIVSCGWLIDGWGLTLQWSHFHWHLYPMMCSVYFPSTPHCSPVSFLELHLHHVPWRTFFSLISSFPPPGSSLPLFYLHFFPCHKIMLFLVDSGGAWNHLRGMIKPKAWRGYLQEVQHWQCPTVLLLFSPSDAKSTLSQGRAAMHIFFRGARPAPCTHPHVDNHSLQSAGGK